MATTTADMGYATINIVYARLVFIAFALITLILSFIVFSKSVTLRMTATGKLMHFLFVVEFMNLVADVFLEAEAIRTFLQSNAVFLNASEVLCRLIYLLHFTSWLSRVWMTVAVVAERTISRTTSLLSHRLFAVRPHIAWIIIGVVIFISVVLGSFPLWTIKPGNREDWCFDYIYVPAMYYIVFTAGITILPVIFVLVLTIWLVVVEVLIRKRRRWNQRNHEDSSEAFVQLQLSYICLVISVLFQLGYVPFSVNVNVIDLFYGWPTMNRDISRYRWSLAGNLAGLLILVYTAIRFILFCVVSSLFKQEIKTLCRCKCSEISDVEENMELITEVTG